MTPRQHVLGELFYQLVQERNLSDTLMLVDLCKCLRSVNVFSGLVTHQHVRWGTYSYQTYRFRYPTQQLRDLNELWSR